MHDSKPLHSRKSARIPDYDYSRNNYYFITICTHEKECIFGTTEVLNHFGKIAWMDLNQMASHYKCVFVDQFVVMPNHVHAIVVIDGDDNANKPTLNHIIGQYKSGVSRKIRKIEPGKLVWQRSFHDHIIRSRSSYEKICSYIKFNPLKWEDDCFYPKGKKP